MKAGKDIVALATEIARRQETKKDFVVASDVIRAVVTPSPVEGTNRASEFEALGGKIIELPANDWQAIAQAA